MFLSKFGGNYDISLQIMQLTDINGNGSWVCTTV